MVKKFDGILLCSVVCGVMLIIFGLLNKHTVSGAPPYGIDEQQVPPLNPYEWLINWKRPDVPAIVGIQVGHWKSNELPDELEQLRGNTGSSGGGKSEWEVNFAIAEQLELILIREGIQVDILPATVPKGYWADIFIAIHADGNLDKTVSGYKFASPWRDLTNEADNLSEKLNDTYGEKTGLVFDPNISRNMRGYYAFSWWRREHAIHPMTTAVIAETGFLTNYRDRQLLIHQPEIPARAIADVLIGYLAEKGLLNN